MTVSSGTVPYSYVDSVGDSTFHFRVHNNLVAPSAVLFEEAMFVLKAEYNRLGAGGQVFSADTIALNDGFHFFISDHASGIFDPHPSGWYLDGTLPITITTDAGTVYTSWNQQATYNMRLYMKDMREVAREIFASIGSKVGLSQWDITKGWLQKYKKYSDGWATTGLFYLEDQNDDNLDIHSSGIFPESDALYYDRYLNEVRYQPMPFLSGFGGSLSFETKPEMTIIPFRPAYYRVNGTLPPLWNSGTIYGDVFVDGITFVASGGGVSGDGNDVYVIDITTSGNENIPSSGEYTPTAGMTEGVYIGYIGSSGSAIGTGLAPWGTGVDFPLHARMPVSDVNLPESGGSQYALYVTDNITAIQPNSDQTSISESGLEWWRPLSSNYDVLDLYVSTPADSGSRRKWGNEFYAKAISNLGANDLYRPGQYAYDRSNDQWWRVGNSGFITLHNNYPLGTGVVTVWKPEVDLISEQFCGALTGSVDGILFYVKSLETITDDGTDLICNGYINSANSITTSVSGALIKLDSSYNMTDAIVSGYQDGRIFYHRGQSEYLYLSNSGSLRRVLEELPSRYMPSGTYQVATLTWGEFTGPFAGKMDFVDHTPTFKANSAPSSLFGGDNHHSWIRTVAFWNDEDTDDLYGMVLAFPSGTTPGSTTNYSRYVVKFDDTGGHPYSFADAWLIGTDNTLTNFDLSMRNHANWSFFGDDFKY